MKDFKQESLLHNFRNYFLKYLFVLRERESAHEPGRERRGEKIPHSLCTEGTEPDVGFDLTNREIVT